MSKITTILSATLIVGAIGGSHLVMTTVAEAAQLYENTDDEVLQVARVDPYAGLIRISLDIPEGKTFKRVVVARPDEDRYRLMSELDAAALGILDGDVEGLVLAETTDLGVIRPGKLVDNWVGFYEYEGDGLRLLERNPADVMYIGLVLADAKTGVESRYYHKVNYRNCAHDQTIISEEIIMCDVKHEAWKAIYVPESIEPTDDAPTWEEELVMLAKNTVKDEFDELGALEAIKVEGGEIDAEQIETLKTKGEAMEFAKFPEMAEIQAIKEDYLTRVVALKTAETGTDQGIGAPSASGGSGTQSDTKPQSSAGAQSAAQGTTQGAANLQNKAESQSTPTVSTENTVKNDVQVEQVSEFNAGSGDKSEEDQEEVAIPKLGGSWLERYGLALIIAGASMTGVIGWLLIGLIGKKRKHDER